MDHDHCVRSFYAVILAMHANANLSTIVVLDQQEIKFKIFT